MLKQVFIFSLFLGLTLFLHTKEKEPVPTEKMPKELLIIEECRRKIKEIKNDKSLTDLTFNQSSKKVLNTTIKQLKKLRKFYVSKMQFTESKRVKKMADVLKRKGLQALEDDKNLTASISTKKNNSTSTKPNFKDPYKLRYANEMENTINNSGISETSQIAVNRALEWLSQNQEDDGHWDTGKHEGAGTPEADTACTAMSLLCFLSAGHTDQSGKYQSQVKKAIAWLIAAQRPNGSFDPRNYSNGMCTMAIGEAYGMGCKVPGLRKSASLAADYLLKKQNASGFFVYTGPSSKSQPSAADDMSITGWCLMGLKSTMLAGLKKSQIKTALNKAKSLMDKADFTKDNTPESKGMSWYRPQKKPSKAGSACQAIALLLRLHQGFKKSEPWLIAAANAQANKNYTQYSKANIYQIYYAALGLFQYGGENWEKWQSLNIGMLVNAQRKDGQFAGSWDMNGSSHLSKGGRIMTSAFICLSLETPYRYPRLK